jgi:hypothetical protein
MAEQLLQLLDRDPGMTARNANLCPRVSRATLSSAATRPRLIYDQFVAALAGSPYEDFALDIRARRRERVAARRWPTFHSDLTATFDEPLNPGLLSPCPYARPDPLEARQ